MGVRRANILERAVRREEVSREIDALRPDLRRVDVELAKRFHDINKNYHYLYERCGNIREYGELHGFSSWEATTYAAAGEALELKPDLTDFLLSGRISLHAVAALGKIYADPRLLKEGDDWFAKAEKLSLRQLQREIQARMVEVYEEGPVSRMDVTMSSKDREKFERARQIACQKERKALDEGETIGVLAEHYLDSFDPDRVEEGKRRVRDTANGDSRYIPASVKREVRRRSGGCCQWPRCDNRIFLNFAHRRWHSRGGSREAANLLDLCVLHHLMLDAGWIRVEGPSDAPIFYEWDTGADGQGGWRRVNGARGPPEEE